MHTIEIENLTKRFGQTNAVDAFQLKIEAQERCVLFGSSGAGKSTLLRLIAGLETPESGRVLLAGQDVTNLPPDRRSVSLVFQDATLYPQLSLRKNLLVAIERLQLPKREVENRIANLLEKLEIGHLADRLPSQISGGEAGRAAFARALIAQPAVLLLDEPLSQLDGLHKANAIALLEQVSAEFKPTMVIVSHDPLDALRLGDQLAVIHQGKLIDYGRPHDVYHHPGSKISGSLLSPFGMNWLRWSSLPQANAAQREDSKEFVGFRPESIMHANEQAAGQASLRMNLKVESQRDLGFAKLILGAVCEQPIQWLTTHHDVPQGELPVAVPENALCWVDE